MCVGTLHPTDFLVSLLVINYKPPQAPDFYLVMVEGTAEIMAATRTAMSKKTHNLCKTLANI